MLVSQVEVAAHAALPATLKAYLPAPMLDVMSAMNKQPGLMDKLNDPQNRYALCLTCGDVK